MYSKMIPYERDDSTLLLTSILPHELVESADYRRGVIPHETADPLFTKQMSFFTKQQTPP